MKQKHTKYYTTEFDSSSSLLRKLMKKPQSLHDAVQNSFH